MDILKHIRKAPLARFQEKRRKDHSTKNHNIVGFRLQVLLPTLQ